jgi:hypothetical protein
MEKKNDNSGRERGGEFCGGAGEVNSNVKGVGQECPTHTSLIDLQAVAEDNCKRMGEAVEAAFLARVCKLRIPVCKPGETANGMTLWWIGGRVLAGTGEGWVVLRGVEISGWGGRARETVYEGRHGFCGGACGAFGRVVCDSD